MDSATKFQNMLNCKKPLARHEIPCYSMILTWCGPVAGMTQAEIIKHLNLSRIINWILVQPIGGVVHPGSGYPEQCKFIGGIARSGFFHLSSLVWGCDAHLRNSSVHSQSVFLRTDQVANLQHIFPVSLGHMGHPATRILSALDGDRVIKPFPQRLIPRLAHGYPRKFWHA